MKKRTILLLFVLFGLFNCKKSINDLATSQIGNNQILSKSEINSRMASITAAKKDFRWSDAPDQVVWSASTYSSNTFSVGYKIRGSVNQDVLSKIHQIDCQSSEWQKAKEEIIDLIWEEEKKLDPGIKREGLLVDERKSLPVIQVRFYGLNTLHRIRNSSLVRYVEPIFYDPSEKESRGEYDRLSSIGCGRATPTSKTLIAGRDYIQITPNSKASWNYKYHSIPEAWSFSTGRGIKVMVIDGGASLSQENLHSAFNQGESSGRTAEHGVTLSVRKFKVVARSYMSVFDRFASLGDNCGHGTMMAGVVAAPRGTDGNACGIAYNCDLMTIKASNDVIIDGYAEILGVQAAFELATRRSDIKIITMSMGTPFYNSAIADAIRKAANKGKLIFCPAGTTLDNFTLTKFWGVVFPANMKETIAVTGIKDDLMSICTTCHTGPEVDFVVVMQKSNLLALTLATSGDTPAIDGGSSVATASMAGMAALVWSKYPEKPASEIKDILKKSSFNPYEMPNWGAGILDVRKALFYDAATKYPLPYKIDYAKRGKLLRERAWQEAIQEARAELGLGPH